MRPNAPAAAAIAAAAVVHLVAHGVGSVNAFCVAYRPLASSVRTAGAPQAVSLYSSNREEARGPIYCSSSIGECCSSSPGGALSRLRSSRCSSLSSSLLSSPRTQMPWSWHSFSSRTTTATSRATLSMRAGGGGGGGGRRGKGESAQNRALAAVVYLLPMLDGIECGENLFRVMPELGAVVYTVLAPALAVWDNVPFLPLVMFILLTISARRQNTSRFVRFNIQQAILVDIGTIILGLLGSAVGYLVPEGEQVLTNFAFYCLIAAVGYAVAETVRGRTANEIPLISAVAEMQIGPL